MNNHDTLDILIDTINERLNTHKLYINENKSTILMNNYDETISIRLSDYDKENHVINSYIGDNHESKKIIAYGKSDSLRWHNLYDTFSFNNSYSINSHELNLMIQNIVDIHEIGEGRFVVIDDKLKLIQRTPINMHKWHINFDIDILMLLIDPFF